MHKKDSWVCGPDRGCCHAARRDGCGQGNSGLAPGRLLFYNFWALGRPGVQRYIRGRPPGLAALPASQATGSTLNDLDHPRSRRPF
ncbi:hypothetical protein L541_2615 [Bordetella hinzii CA90 BAL1384]|nr:hypothetical protein L541_2615 [Bordetella hinzii CA90 BAL1384]